MWTNERKRLSAIDHIGDGQDVGKEGRSGGTGHAVGPRGWGGDEGSLGGGRNLGPIKLAKETGQNPISMVASGSENRDCLDAFTP